MRTIDADALWKEFCKSEAIEERYGSGVLEIIGNIIDNAPTIDAVPINRCKTCYFWNTEANEPEDKKHGLCELNRIGTDDCFYCGAWTKDAHDFFNGDRDDWVSVVRCKDCKCWTEWATNTGSCSRFALDWIGTDADDFCSMGERKDND